MSTTNKIIIEDSDNNKIDNNVDNDTDNSVIELGSTKDNSHIIFINELSEQIIQLTKEDNKNDFIKNYNEYHKKIKKVDDILFTVNNIDSTLDIKILFEMLNEYGDLINQDDISVQDYKNINDLVTIIESKLKNENISIKEIP